MPSWLWMALLSAVLWGLHYPLIEKALEGLKPLTMMFIVGVAFVSVVPFINGELFSDLSKLKDFGSTKY
jgi:drug/metabolite transporter (DMT)-like permease